MHEVIGNPTDYSNNKQNGGFDRQVDLRIPTHKTDQKKPMKVGANSQVITENNETGDQPISNLLNDNFNRMQI
jgi:hypothetical protein